MRRIAPVLLLVLLAAPLAAQKAPKRDRFKIVSEELAEYGNQSLTEVISKARPHFFLAYGGNTGSLVEAGITGIAARLLIFVGQQSHGDTSVLRHYKASEVKEIRYYKPSEAMTRLGADNAYVIQLIMKPIGKG
jgi:hypothetical protein